MKKPVLLYGLLSTVLLVNAQQRLVLYERFTGENCGPCATTNPGLWSLLSANTDHVILVTYQVPIPSPGPIYLQNTEDVEIRKDYYSVHSAPQSKVDGKLIRSNTQAMLDTSKAAPTNFSVTLSNPTISPSNDLSAEISITSTATYAGSNLKLRAALVESLHFDLPPGTNGEVDFHNVMRKMFPSADGQTIENNWTANQTETYTVSGQIPDYVDKHADELFLVVWIQEDGWSNANSVLQAAKSEQIDIVLPVGVSSKAIDISESLVCTPGEVVPIVTIKNTGEEPLTEAKIYYKIGNDSRLSWQEHVWTGNLEANATEVVTLPAVTLAAASGNITIRDSVAMPNNQQDDNWADNTSENFFVTVNTNSVTDLPVSSNFESSPTDWVSFGQDRHTPMTISSMQVGASDYRGYDNSRFAVAYPNFAVSVGTSGFLALPVSEIPAGPKAMDFYVAYAQQTAENDKLEIVYSEDCGESWTTVWEKSGSELTTVEPIGSQDHFMPADNSDWRFESVDASVIPAGNALVAFRATSDRGSYLFLDNVTLRSGEPNGIDDLMMEYDFQIYPNPVQADLILEIVMRQSIRASLSVFNFLGEEVKKMPANLQAGHNKISLPTADLAAGIYVLNIQTEVGTFQRKFVKP